MPEVSKRLRSPGAGAHPLTRTEPLHVQMTDALDSHVALVLMMT